VAAFQRFCPDIVDVDATYFAFSTVGFIDRHKVLKRYIASQQGWKHIQQLITVTTLRVGNNSKSYMIFGFTEIKKVEMIDFKWDIFHTNGSEVESNS